MTEHSREHETDIPDKRFCRYSLRAVLTATEAASLLATQPVTSPVPTESGWIFFYRGAADGVELAIMEDRFTSGGAMARTDESELWFSQVDAPADALVEYRLAVTRHGRTRHIMDPANPSKARDPFGTNSVAYGHAYRAPSWIDQEAEEGTIEDFDVSGAAWQRTRRHVLYMPPGYDSEIPSPLMILHDGPEYLDYTSFGKCLSLLVASGRIRPPLVLLHDPAQRHTEYADNPRHVSHVIDEVIPALRTNHNIDRVVAGGASLGGVGSISLAYRRPGEVDALMLQSGSFVEGLGGRYNRGRVLAPAARLTREILANPATLPDRMVMSCGTFDGLVEDNRRFASALAEDVPQLIYGESNAGHHWLCWRDRLEADLVAALAD